MVFESYAKSRYLAKTRLAKTRPAEPLRHATEVTDKENLRARHLRIPTPSVEHGARLLSEQACFELLRHGETRRHIESALGNLDGSGLLDGDPAVRRQANQLGLPADIRRL